MINENQIVQLSSLARENTILLEELCKMRKNLLGANQSNKEPVKKQMESTIDIPATGISTTGEIVETPTSTTASNQVLKSYTRFNSCTLFLSFLYCMTPQMYPTFGI